MKNIVINGGILRNKNVYGVQRFSTEVLKELDNIIDSGTIKLVIPSAGDLLPEFTNIEVVTLENPRQSKFEKFKWDQFSFPRYVMQNDAIGVDLLVALPFSGVDIVTVYDCRTILFPNNAKSLSEKLKRLFYKERVRISTKKSKIILTDSESAKKDICRIFKCNEYKVKVIYGAWQHFLKIQIDESVINEFGLCDAEYFFSLGSQMRHKNLKWIVCAARQNPQYKFVVTGNNNVNEFDIESRENVPHNILYTGYLSDEKVKALMKHCKAFIQPSMYEGFGMPPMEAMSVGAKCIVSNVSSLPEVYGNSVWYINPNLYENIEMEKIMSSKINDNSEVLNKYNWRNSAEALKDILNQIEKSEED